MFSPYLIHNYVSPNPGLSLVRSVRKWTGSNLIAICVLLLPKSTWAESIRCFLLLSVLLCLKENTNQVDYVKLRINMLHLFLEYCEEIQSFKHLNPKVGLRSLSYRPSREVTSDRKLLWQSVPVVFINTVHKAHLTVQISAWLLIMWQKSWHLVFSPLSDETSCTF